MKLIAPINFNSERAKICAQLVRSAYALHDLTKQGATWNVPKGFEEFGKLYANGVPFGFVARKQDWNTNDIYVAFRGTEEINEWYADFAFPQVNLGWGSIELGFWTIYKQFQEALKATVKKAIAAPANLMPLIYITGHSLGAALAAPASIDIAQNIPTLLPPKMYSFAGPRVGDIKFSSVFNKAVSEAYRIVNTEDVVTTVPPATAVKQTGGLLANILDKFIYEHVGIPCSFTTNKGTITANHSMGTYEEALT